MSLDQCAVRRLSAFVQISLCAAILSATGCSGRSLPGEVGTVTGKVTTQDGLLQPNSVVVYVHQAKGIVAVGLLDAEGNYTLRMRGGPQVLVGDYYVGVAPPEATKQEAEIVSAKPAVTTTAPRLGIPKKYLTPETSGLTALVKPGPNTISFELK